MSVLLPGRTTCLILRVCSRGLACASQESRQPLELPSGAVVASASVEKVLGHCFLHQLPRFGITQVIYGFNSTFHFPLPLSLNFSAERTERYRCSHTPSYSWNRSHCYRYVSNCGKNLCLDSTSCIWRTLTSLFCCQLAVTAGVEVLRVAHLTEASYGDQLPPNPIPPWAFCAPLNSCKPQLP